APALHEPRDGHAPPAVVPGGWPHRAMHGGVELAGDHARRETAVRREDLVGADHREPVPQRHHDPRVDPRELARKNHMAGDADQAGAIVPVVPVDPEQVERVALVRPNAVERRADPARNQGRLRELPEGGQDDPVISEPPDRPLVGAGVHQGPLQPERAHVAREYADWTIPARRAEGPPFGGPLGLLVRGPRGVPFSGEPGVPGSHGGFGRVEFTLNGREVSIEAPGGATLLELLREGCGLTSMKDG